MYNNNKKISLFIFFMVVNYIKDAMSVSFDQNCLHLTFYLNNNQAVNPTK